MRVVKMTTCIGKKDVKAISFPTSGPLTFVTFITINQVFNSSHYNTENSYKD